MTFIYLLDIFEVDNRKLYLSFIDGKIGIGFVHFSFSGFHQRGPTTHFQRPHRGESGIFSFQNQFEVW